MSVVGLSMHSTQYLSEAQHFYVGFYYSTKPTKLFGTVLYMVL